MQLTLPPRLLADLQASADMAAALRAGQLIKPAPPSPAQAELARLRARVAELEAAAAASIERIHREDRLDKVTLRIVDNTAKFTGRRQAPAVILTSGDCYVRISPAPEDRG